MTEEEKNIDRAEKERQRREKSRQRVLSQLLPYGPTYNAKYYQAQKIELRSEKVRNIIGQVPPVLIRYGIMIIGISLLMLIGISFFIPYQSGVDVEINVTQSTDGTLQYSTCIPQSAMRNRSKFTEVVLNLSTELPLPTRFKIESVSDIVQFLGEDAWQTAILRPIEKISENVLLKNSITLPGKILLEKQSVMMWVVGKVVE